MTDMDSAFREAASAAEAASNTKVLDVVARCGFAVMALLHIVVGAIAVAVAFGQPGEPEPTGAIEQFAENPWGPFVMWSCAAGCAGLALWQLSEATLRVRREPRTERVSKLISSGSLSLVYGSVGFTFASFAEGTRSGRVISALGVAGHVAKGVALKLVGLLFIIAAVKNNAAESTGLDGSLKALRDHPWGPLLLTAIGAGFMCYGIFALLRSRFGRM
jgi:hypothetical protein